MPSKTSTGKQPSGHANRKKAAERIASVALLPDLPPPPDDDLQLVLWGARTSAAMAHRLATMTTKLDGTKVRLFKDFLATLGLLHPRAEIQKRLKAIIAAKKTAEEGEGLTPIAGIDPGPTGRFRRQG